jgi:hypothetical protein
MKVKQLVAKLKSYNQEARVLIQSTSDEDDLAYAYDVGWSYEDGTTNKDKVIIE